MESNCDKLLDYLTSGTYRLGKLPNNVLFDVVVAGGVEGPTNFCGATPAVAARSLFITGFSHGCPILIMMSDIDLKLWQLEIRPLIS